MNAFLKLFHGKPKEQEAQASSVPETNVFLALAAGLGATVALWLLNNKVIEAIWPNPEPESGEAALNSFQVLQARLFDRGFIPFFILWAFFVGMHLLWQVYRRQYLYIKGSREKQAGLIKTALQRGIDRQRLDEIDQEVRKKVEQLYLPAGSGGREEGATSSPVPAALSSGNESGQAEAQKVEGFYEEKFVKLFAMRRNNLIDYIRDFKNEWLANDEGNIAVAFTPVRFSEWSLPLLGFLGTVLGIASSINSMQSGVQLLFEGKGTQETVSENIKIFFNQGFKDLALAFDTTFLGLLFLIIVGSLHYLLRNAIAKEISFASDLFTHVIGGWQAVIEASTVRAVEALHDTAIDTFVELESGNEYKKKHDNFVLDIFEKIVDEAEGEVFKSMRDVLFSRVVEASANIGIHIGPELKRLQEVTRIQQFKIQAVSVSASASNKAVLSVCDAAGNGASYLQLISITERQETPIYCPLPRKAEKVAIDYFGDMAITQDEEGNLSWIRTSGIKPDSSPASFLSIASDGDWIIPVRIKSTARFLAIYKGPQNTRELEYQFVIYGLNSAGNFFAKPVDKISPDLKVELRGNIHQVAVNGANLIALHFYDEEKKESRILACTLELKEERESGEEGVAVRGSEEKSKTVKILSLKVIAKDTIMQEVRQLTFISENELVYLTEESRPQYFNIDSGLIFKPRFVRFREEAKLSQGAFNHFAVAERDRLKMYRAKYGRTEPVIVDYGTGIGDDKDYFVVEGGLAELTSPPSGQFAVGVSSSRRDLFVWRFPQNYLDFKKSTIPRN